MVRLVVGKSVASKLASDVATRLTRDAATMPAAEVLAALGTSSQGLTEDEAARRLDEQGPADFANGHSLTRTRVLLRQIESPLLWLLLFAALISMMTGAWSEAAIVLTIVGATVVIGFVREDRAQHAVDALRARIQTLAKVVRDSREREVPRRTIVVGDIILLSAGSLVPADAVILEARDCFVTEAALTGESFPVEKFPGPTPAGATLGERTNCVFLGTNVRSGTARCVVVATGRNTKLAGISKPLLRPPPPTAFDQGIRRFGYLLTSTMLVIVMVVFAIHMVAGRPPVETLLFSIALAVGLSPELLPAILSVNLARGAQLMARRGVLVRRLNAIENLGGMDVLCTDKTGTLTEGRVRLEGAYDPSGTPSPSVLQDAVLNAGLQTGLQNPLDEAILEAHGSARPPSSIKLAEIPFDFMRKRLGVVVATSDGARLIVKGALTNVLDVCAFTSGGVPLDADGRTAITTIADRWSADGVRVVAVASRVLDRRDEYGRTDECDLTFEGYLTFLDRPKDGVSAAIADLNRLGVSVKIITGDNRLVARHVASLVGLPADRVLSGAELAEMSDAALWRVAPLSTLFVEVDPNQKERIIAALRRAGHTVGFLGDGINDAPAMHAADTSLSVDGAVDVARETADFVLLDRDLDVIRAGIEEGRRTFANTMKYVLTTTSANLGNMISMAIASLALPFLPLLAGQILLNNLLSDVPAIGLADDRVDPELVRTPEHWNIRFIWRFIAEFGLVSSIFDVVTFVVLLWGFHVSVELFRTGWFVESLLTELVVALVVRTRRSVFSSRPGTLLLVTSLIMIGVTPLIPYLPGVHRLGFVPVPAVVLVTLVAITLMYVAATELTKFWFYRRSPETA